MRYTFDNEVQVQILSGESGEVINDWTGHNAISDDVLCQVGHIYLTPFANSGPPYCFILPDGTNWTGFTYDRTNPSAPYCIAVNNFVDTSADPQWKLRSTYTAPNNVVTGRHKLFFQWSNLPTDFQLKAIGLTGWQSDANGGNITNPGFGIVDQQQTVLVPQTLVILPSSVLVHGRNGGSGTPDILQVSYFLSIVGAS